MISIARRGAGLDRIEVTAHTLSPDWCGESMDYNHAQQLLRQYDR